MARDYDHLFKLLIIGDSVGNKNDDPHSKVVLTEDSQRFADQMGIKLFETSAKENINVEEMFMAITRMVLRMKKDNKARELQSQENAIRLGQKGTRNHKGKKNKCC
ncbi:Ras-related protein Rab-35-like protein [Leptotrombidium deliense]|uniref:Ras-related protein Rab-35-like protein n=1 Tax=Leptotrombidium deliense TaxID=299467 RepID=A0A443S7S9_9ACAR|nr:Ras-related protein Rab-35-like protein [Leptotrombidium deliense]